MRTPLSLLTGPTHPLLIASVAILMLMLMVVVPTLWAGAPTATFLDDLSMELTDWMTGTLGKFFAIATLIVSVAVAAFHHNFMVLFAGIGVSAAAFFGPAAIQSIFTAVLLP